MERAFLNGEMTALPATVGRLRLLSRIGRGGMAEVFLAELLGAGAFRRRVVAKRMRPDLAERPLYPAMFEREAVVLAGLHHENIVGVVDFIEIDGERWLLLEHVDGPSLSALAKGRPHRRLPVDAACAAAAAAARALHIVHSSVDDEGRALGLVHRDVSPDNLAITSAGVVKLLDFGIVKGASSAQLTTVGALKGKFPYLSPEQIHGHPLDGRADLWALGVVLFQLLVGQRPFRGQTDVAVMNAILEEHPSPPSLSTPGVPAAVDEIVLRLLQKDANQRFATGAAVADALSAAVPIKSFALARLLADDGDEHDDTTMLARSLFKDARPASVTASVAPPSSSSPPASGGPRGWWSMVDSLVDDDVVEVDERSGTLSRVAVTPLPATSIARKAPAPSSTSLPPRERSRPPATRAAALVGALVGGGIVVGVAGIVGVASEETPTPVLIPATPVPTPAPAPVPEPAAPIVEPTPTPTPTPPTPPSPTTTTTAPTTPRPAKAPPGTLTIVAVPWARVSVDGDDVGDTPIAALKLEAGTHKVRLRGENGELLRDAVVKSGKGTTLKVKMP